MNRQKEIEMLETNRDGKKGFISSETIREAIRRTPGALKPFAELNKELMETYRDALEETEENDKTKHIAWMLDQLQTMDHTSGAPFERWCRWLGFVQGVLWTLGLFTVDELREQTRSLLLSERS